MSDKKPSAKVFLEFFGENSLVEATGTTHSDLQVDLIQQLLEALWIPKEYDGEELSRRIQAGIATLREIKPQDALEGSLAVQMVAIHHAALECLKQAIDAQYSPQRLDYIRQADKLMSLYLRQIEALDKHRGAGVTRVNVENVNVQAGGQAVVGHVQPERMLTRPEVEVSPTAKSIEHRPVESLDLMSVAPVHSATKSRRHESS